MTITISPLDLKLDTKNPRFVVLQSREQFDIRKYLVTYEDVCQLATDINAYGSLLPGERIVILIENGDYIVVEGNRRTCSLQLLLSHNLIPDGFKHRFPPTSVSILENCNMIEVDVLPDRNTALELMSKRHIKGVKQWKPLAKKQFFASNYKDGLGQSIQNLSKITGIKEGEIKEDIRDYKFFFSTYEKYITSHPDFNKEIINLKTDPFWRIFKAKFPYKENKIKPSDFLKISYDEMLNTVSALDESLFNRIVQLVFEKAIVTEEINTRNVLTDVKGIFPLLQEVADSANKKNYTDQEKLSNSEGGSIKPLSEVETTSQLINNQKANVPKDYLASYEKEDDLTNNIPPKKIESKVIKSENLPCGGPAPRTFFETISWSNKLNKAEKDHQGLLYAINELHNLSKYNCGNRKAYKVFAIATGMVLRTVYEQSLILILKHTNLWGEYNKNRNNALPTLRTIEDFINQGENKRKVFPKKEMLLTYDRVIAAKHRDFLNANTHYLGNINVTPDSLEAIADGGMFALIQGIIDSIE